MRKVGAEEWVRAAHASARPVAAGVRLEADGPHARSVEIFALGALAGLLDDDRVGLLVDRLLDVGERYVAEGRTSLQALLSHHAPAVAHMAELMRRALAEMRAGGLSSASADLMQFVSRVQLSDQAYRQLLGGVHEAEWATHPEAAALLVCAASSGVASARAALERLAAEPGDLDPTMVRALFSSPSSASIESDAVFEQVVRIALGCRAERAIVGLLADPKLRKRRWETMQEPLLEHIEALLESPDGRASGKRLQGHLLMNRGELVPWGTAFRALETADESTLVAILGVPRTSSSASPPYSGGAN